MKTLTLVIAGDTLTRNDVPALARHFASVYEQELIHKDAGPSETGGYAVPFDEREFSLSFAHGAAAEVAPLAPAPEAPASGGTISAPAETEAPKPAEENPPARPEGTAAPAVEG